ncbi:MAG: hypothetical protein Q8R63_09880 [Ramlibacter sp.]|nr:hypothetical protein [Ramlibacter sp.]
MDPNLIPFDAYSLESLAPSVAGGASNTLTLQLSLGALPGLRDPMTGTASVSAATPKGPLRAAIVPADGGALTITFQI